MLDINLVNTDREQSEAHLKPQVSNSADSENDLLSEALENEILFAADMPDVDTAVVEDHITNLPVSFGGVVDSQATASVVLDESVNENIEGEVAEECRANEVASESDVSTDKPNDETVERKSKKKKTKQHKKRSSLRKK